MPDVPPEPATRVLVSPDGALVARVVTEHIELVNGATLAVESEVGIDPAAEACDVVLAGDPLRLVVLARYDGHVRLHAIDPRGPTSMGELPIKQPLRMLGAAGDHVWLTGPAGSVVVDVVRKELAMWPLALRTPVSAAGSFSNGRFVISTVGLLEEWDAETRAPVRRFRMGKAVPAAHVGGGARQVWLVPGDAPERIEIVPLIKAGQPPRIELPEPIARISADPAHENLIAVGAKTRTAYAIDLSGRTPVTPLEGLNAEDAAWLGATGSVVVAAAGLGLEVVAVAGRARPGIGERPEARVSAPAAAAATSAPTTVEAAPAGNVAERLSAWRERMRAAAPRDAPATPAWIGPAEAPVTWRDHLATWTRSIRSGTRGEPPVLGEGPLADVAERLGLDAELTLGLWLLYGAHLCGHDVAPVELAELLRRRWDEALGRGTLASLGVARWKDGRARLTRVVSDFLDERAPQLGTAVASSAPPTATTAIVAPRDARLPEIADWAAPRLGPLFLPTSRGERRLDRFFVEARIRGGVPLLRWPRAGATLPAAAVLVVEDEAAARAVPAPVFATWPPLSSSRAS